ncbi:enoyl-CoA hydratase/isomerase family protein [Luedemannella helvata]|uniref:Enoyl-CoA hydratase-related protein n=1 Tax=Luedemannella helvata TaxID=349315 RepID=A0ABP4VZ68_9ACTN
MSTVTYEVADKVAVITMNRPDKLNAMNFEMRCELAEVWRRVEADPDVWVAIVTGAGRAFSVGHDLVEVVTPEMKLADPDAAGVYGGIADIYKPVIAAVNGMAYAGGSAVALMSDIRIASTTAKMGWPQVRHGISSVSGPTILSRLLPMNQAYEFLFTGDDLLPQRALELGLLNAVVEPDQLMKKAYEYAERILRCAPLALRNIKYTTAHTKGLSLRDAIAIGEKTGDLVHHTEDAKNGLKAFAERRTPQWTGR